MRINEREKKKKRKEKKKKKNRNDAKTAKNPIFRPKSASKRTQNRRKYPKTVSKSPKSDNKTPKTPYENTHFCFFSAGLRIWNEHMSVSSTDIMELII
jgi:hypothetical protein